MSGTRNLCLTFNEQHVCSLSHMARIQWPSSFVTAPWHLHSNTLFPLRLLHLLPVILVFLMSSDPSLVLLTPFLPQMFPNSHASHVPQISLRASLLQDLSSLSYTFKYVNIYFYTDTHVQCVPCTLPTLFSMADDPEKAGRVANLTWDLCWLG